MGALTSMCDCERTSKTKQPPLPSPTNPRQDETLPPVQQPHRQQPIIQKPQQSHQCLSQQPVIKTIEERFPPPHDKKSLKWTDFQITHRIGSGGFGEVFLGELIENQQKGMIQKYAIKRIPLYEVIQKKLTASIKLEKKILQNSSCPFITTLHYALRDAKYLYLVMEWAQGGDVYSFISEKSARLEKFRKAGEDAVRFILGCIVLGLEYLHSKNIMYRDLKPENILIFEDGYAKLTDFGLAKEIHADELAKTEAGTSFYYAPEMVLQLGYGREVDIWALGIFAYEISNYSPPFAGPDIKDRRKVKRLVKLAEANRKWQNPSIGQDLRDFIDAILRFEPKERLGYYSWNDIKAHKFFSAANFNWSELAEAKMKSPIRTIIESHKERYKPYKAEQNKKVPQITSKSAEEQFYTWSKNSNQR